MTYEEIKKGIEGIQLQSNHESRSTRYEFIREKCKKMLVEIAATTLAPSDEDVLLSLLRAGYPSGLKPSKRSLYKEVELRRTEARTREFVDAMTGRNKPKSIKKMTIAERIDRYFSSKHE